MLGHLTCLTHRSATADHDSALMSVSILDNTFRWTDISKYMSASGVRNSACAACTICMQSCIVLPKICVKGTNAKDSSMAWT